MTQILSYEELEKIFHLSTDMIGSGNLDGHFTRINSSFGRILGYADEEFLAKPFFSFVHDEDIQNTKEAFAHAVNEKVEFRIENRYKCKDGQYKWVEWKVLSITQENLFIAVGREVTKQKQAKEALRQATQIINKSPVVAFLWKNAEGWPVEFVSGNVSDVLGYTMDDLLSGSVSYADIVHPEDLERVMQEVAEFSKDQKTEDFIHKPYRIITRGGQVRWIDDRTNIQRNKSGAITHYQGIVLDITEQKIAEDALRKNEQFLNAIFDSIQDGISILDENLNIVRVNQSIRNWYAHMLPLEGKKCYHAYHGRSKTCEVCPTVRSLKTGKLEMNEVPFVQADGQAGTMELFAFPMLDESGKPKAVIEYIRDITGRKKNEEEKKKALAFAAEQRKHALIGKVAGKMAHDFNNVLMGIMGNAQLAIMDCDDEKIRQMLEHINEFSERGRDITKTLISFSKDQEPKQTNFRVVDKIELVLKMLEKDLAGIEISRNYKSGIPALLADPGMIQDVLVNLILNSIHAMSKVENPTLDLKVYYQNDKVYFEIEDNGCGIPKEHQDAIFTPSFTLKGSHDRTGSYKSGIRGTGFGMSNVKKYIVEKHKGDISLESEVGKGTRIKVGLKVIKDHLAPHEKKEVVQRQIFDQRRILLVEDEAAIADVQYQILTKEPFGHIVSIASNGQTAMDVFDRNNFDLVSLDYMLPGKINGLDVYKHIRQKDGDIPVMFISGNIEFLESVTKLKEKDPNLDHLSKPVDNLAYVNKINELVGRRVLKKND